AGKIVATLEDVAPDRRQVRIPRLTRLGRLLLEIHTEREHLLRGQILRHAVHGVALAPTRFEVDELLGDVLMMLPCQARIQRRRAVALRAVAQRAASATDLGGARQIDLRQLCRHGGQRQAKARSAQYDQSVPRLHGTLLSEFPRLDIIAKAVARNYKNSSID